MSAANKSVSKNTFIPSSPSAGATRATTLANLSNSPPSNCSNRQATDNPFQASPDGSSSRSVAACKKNSETLSSSVPTCPRLSDILVPVPTNGPGLSASSCPYSSFIVPTAESNVALNPMSSRAPLIDIRRPTTDARIWRGDISHALHSGSSLKPKIWAAASPSNTWSPSQSTKRSTSVPCASSSSTRMFAWACAANLRQYGGRPHSSHPATNLPTPALIRAGSILQEASIPLVFDFSPKRRSSASDARTPKSPLPATRASAISMIPSRANGETVCTRSPSASKSSWSEISPINLSGDKRESTFKANTCRRPSATDRSMPCLKSGISVSAIQSSIAFVSCGSPARAA